MAPKNPAPASRVAASHAAAISRRDWLVLAGLLAASYAATRGLVALRPPGEIVPDSPALAATLAEEGPEALNPGASLRMIVFTDFNCPVCRSEHPGLLAAARADGDVRLRFLPWPIFGDDSRAAARVALAADDQGLYLPVHNALMADGRATAAAAEEALAAAGGSVARLRDTLQQSGPAIDGLLSRAAVHAFALGLPGTPGHLAGRVLLRGAASEREFRRLFARARASDPA